jgi:hypothetical protein
LGFFSTRQTHQIATALFAKIEIYTARTSKLPFSILRAVQPARVARKTKNWARCAQNKELGALRAK